MTNQPEWARQWEAHPIYKSAFGYREGDVWHIVGHLERWPGWEQRLEEILDRWNAYEAMLADRHAWLQEHLGQP